MGFTWVYKPCLRFKPLGNLETIWWVKRAIAYAEVVDWILSHSFAKKVQLNEDKCSWGFIGGELKYSSYLY